MTTPWRTYGHDGLYLLLRVGGSAVAVASALAVFSGEHALQALSRYAVAAGWDGVASVLVVTDARLVEAGAAAAPWISASLLLSVLLVVALEGRLKHGLASAAALLFGATAYCPPMQPLAWLLLFAVFVVPAVFVVRARGFANAFATIRSASGALALSAMWMLAWPELLRRSRQHDVDRVTVRRVTTSSQEMTNELFSLSDQPASGDELARPGRIPVLEADTVGAIVASVVGVAAVITGCMGLIEVCAEPFRGAAAVVTAIGGSVVVAGLLGGAGWAWWVDRTGRSR